jgi:WXG100 family type VII secretion target
MNSFTTSTADTTVAAARVDQVATALAGRLRDLDARIASLAGAWRGSAALGFEHLCSVWRQEAATLVATLATMSEQLRGTAANYERADAEQTAALARITAVLSPR